MDIQNYSIGYLIKLWISIYRIMNIQKYFSVWKSEVDFWIIFITRF